MTPKRFEGITQRSGRLRSLPSPRSLARNHQKVLDKARGRG